MESGIDNKKNILIITSFLSNDNSSKMILDVSKALKNDYHIDVLTKYPFSSELLNVQAAYNKFEKFTHTALNYAKAKIKSLRPKTKSSNNLNKLPYYFFGLNEEIPPVPTYRITRKIIKEYEFVIVFFWQGLVTSKTLEEIYNKIGKPLLLVAADMFPMTGGCSYFWDCDRLQYGCGMCPGLTSNNPFDKTHHNFLFKQSIFKKINSVFLGNSWQTNHAKLSGLFNNYGKIYPIVDENVFRPRDKELLKHQYNFTGKIVLFFGSLGVHDPRKGFKYLIESLDLLIRNRPDLSSQIILVVAGSGGKVSELEKFEVAYTGHLSFDQLAIYYAMADVFLSPSIQDAGPMMLNQALMCGTPAVAFDIGTACDIISNETGYRAKYRDSKDFSNGIIKLITMSKTESIVMSQVCRTVALNTSSYSAFRNDILTGFELVRYS